MVQKVEERDGHMFLHFGEPPGHIGEIAFVSCVAHQQGRILFCKWRDSDIWVVPGGRVEPGERPEETARRELLEETGATLKTLDTLCHIHCFMFNATYWGIAYFGKIETLGTPTDLTEVSEARLFSCFPENPTAPGPFENQSRALYEAAQTKFRGDRFIDM